MRVVTYPLFCLLYWFIFLIGVSLPAHAPFAFLYLLILVFGVFILVGRLKTRRQVFFWLNFLFYCMGSYLFVMTISVESLRIVYSLVSGCIAASMMTFIHISHGETRTAVVSPFREPLFLVYALSFWQLLSVLYFLRIFYAIPVYSLLLMTGIATMVLCKGIFEVKKLRKSSEFFVISTILIASVELAYSIHLLPLHYMTLASLLSLWIAVILHVVDAGQHMTSRRVIFRRYIVVYAVMALLILLTARWG